MQIAAFPKCYIDQIAGDRTMSVFDWIDQARSLDADGLEMYDGFFTSLEPVYLDQVGEAIAAAGFAMPMLCCSPDFTNPDADASQACRRSPGNADRRGAGGWEAHAQFAGSSPASAIPKSIDDRGWNGSPNASIRSLIVAREQDIVLGLENHYKDSFWKYPEFAQKMDVFLELLEMISDRDHFGVQYDPSNAIVAGDDPIALLRAVAGRVVSMHASDRYLAEGANLDDLRQTDGTLGYSPNLRHGVTGKGLNDYHTIFRILADHQYRGWISIEDGMNGMDEMAESLAFLRRMGAMYFPGMRPRWTVCALPWSAAARSATRMPRPWPAFPSQNSSPSATSSPSELHRSRTAFKFGHLMTSIRCSRKAAPTFSISPRLTRFTPAAAIAAARAGVHVLVEKPLAASISDCDAMLAAAREHHTKLGVISQRRWYEPVRRMKDAIDAGKIGRPVLGTFTMYSWRDPAYYQSDPWRRPLGHRRRRRSSQSVSPHARPARRG